MIALTEIILSKEEKVMSKVYIIDGNPVAWARPSPYRGRMWDTQKQLKFQYGVYLREQHAAEPLLVGPLHLEIKFYFHLAKSTKKSLGDFHMFKPDLSNLIKLIEDVGSGILYEDDALIASITASKIYDSSPRIEFSLHTLNEGRK